MPNKIHKAINFDLDTNALKKIFTDDYSVAYKQIKKFMLDNGFSHRQYSGYISDKPLSEKDIYKLIYDLKNTLPWIMDKVNKFDVTDIGLQYDLTNNFKSDIQNLDENLELSFNDDVKNSDNKTNNKNFNKNKSIRRQK